MQVLIILNNQNAQNVRLVVRLHTRWLRRQVDILLKEKRDRDAFNLIVSKARVESYLNPGEKPRQRPVLTLIEDML